jgi:hypothetical protein
LQQDRWKKQFGNSSGNEASEVALAAKFKSKGSKQREENDGNKSSKSGKYRKAIKCFYCGKLGHISRVCRKQLWDEKHNQEHSSNDQSRKKHANVAEHKEEFYVFMARNKDSKSGKDDWYVDSGASRHFTNNIDWYVDFVEDKFQSDSVVLSGKKEYKVRGKGNVLLQLRGKKVMIKDVYYVPCLDFDQ